MNKITQLLAAVLLLSACKKDPETRPVHFTSTDYQTLSPYDDAGTPTNLAGRDAVSNELYSYSTQTLPEKTDLRKTNPELLKSKAIADISITQSSDVYITFVSQGTGWYNSLAYYTYPTANPPKSAQDIDTITYFFPNAGNQTHLNRGDKVKLGRFTPGTSIGFVLLYNSWDPATKKINSKAVHYCSNDVLNPEVNPDLKKHAVLINYPQENKILIGFEDMDRTSPECDHDFNDVVVYATVQPA